MALIKKEKKETLKRLSIRIEAGLLEQLNHYASHLESSKDHVIAEAVRYIIARDREFAQHLPQIPPTNVGNVPSKSGGENPPHTGKVAAK